MNDLFLNISEEDKKELLNKIGSFNYNYSKNEIIPKDIFFKKTIGIINTGSISIIKINYNETEYIVDNLYEGDLFSNMSYTLLDDDYEIIANENTCLSIIDFNKIISLNCKHEYFNQFLKNILEIISNKMLTISFRIEVMSNKTIRNKLLTYFKHLSKKYNSNTIYLPFTYTSLANYLAVDRSAMNRELKSLKEEGLIETKGTRIKLKFYIN